jgi:dihydroneopterin aldolase
MAITSHLLEHVCGRIISRLKAAFPSIDELRVRVSKMNPPMGGKMDKVTVEFAEKY